MNCLVRYTALLMFAASIAPLAIADAELDALEKKLVEKWSQIESLSAKISMNTEMDMGGGAKMSSKGEGTMEFMKKGDKEMMRSEMNVKMSMPGQEMESSSLTINDGEYTYTVSEMMGQKNAMKQKTDKTQGSPIGTDMFENLKKDNTVSVLPDEKVSGTDAHVIKAVPKSGGQPGMNSMKMYFAKDNGVMIQMLGLDDAGKTVMTMNYSDVKVNSKIDPDRFVFKAPPGVTVTEMP